MQDHARDWIYKNDFANFEILAEDLIKNFSQSESETLY